MPRNRDNGGPSPSSLRRARLARFSGRDPPFVVGDRVEARVGNCEFELSRCFSTAYSLEGTRNAEGQSVDPANSQGQQSPLHNRQGNGTTLARFPRCMGTARAMLPLTTATAGPTSQRALSVSWDGGNGRARARPASPTPARLRRHRREGPLSSANASRQSSGVGRSSECVVACLQGTLGWARWQSHGLAFGRRE